MSGTFLKCAACLSLEKIGIFPQQQNAIGSLRNVNFGVFWASWGGFGKTGFREPFDGFWRVRFCSRGLGGTGSGNRVLGTQGMKKVPDSGDSVRKVLKVTLYFDSIPRYFENKL